MKLVNWECPNSFCMPMVEDDDLNLWGVTKGAAGAYGVTEDAIDHMFRYHKDRLGLNPSPPRVKEFFRQHRAVFGIQRVRRILSENDVLILGMMFRTPEAIQAQMQFLTFIKTNMKKNFVTMADFKALLDRVEAFEAGVPYVQRSASAVGAALRAHRSTKHLRLVK